MFIPGRWASAFINSLSIIEVNNQDLNNRNAVNQDAGNIESGIFKEGLEAFRELSSWVIKLPGEISGRRAAEKIERLVRAAVSNCSPAMETAIRFILLLVKKNVINHAGEVIKEIEKILDRKFRIVRVIAESVSLSDNSLSLDKGFSSENHIDESHIDQNYIDENHIKEAVKKMTGCAVVEIKRKANPSLIGGYRLRIGDIMIDASVRGQLKKLEKSITAGDGGL